ncbi:hypothetical protein E2562_032928 [Oryza meyeriana var. granulata]|uniref:Uncharacterized protein n=1 Tax=Oryza meyeriana var. granulata TaxID=110450 RepID=A0A6G1DQQ4_9ORYZ|nr:hypothetical protein E2562_032928 [Oryza meyeriana var. granulata]
MRLELGRIRKGWGGGVHLLVVTGGLGPPGTIGAEETRALCQRARQARWIGGAVRDRPPELAGGGSEQRRSHPPQRIEADTVANPCDARSGRRTEGISPIRTGWSVSEEKSGESFGRYCHGREASLPCPIGRI